MTSRRAPSTDVAPLTRLEALCEGVIEAGWLAALAVVPLFFNPYSQQSFEPNKVALLRIVVLTMTAAWLVKIAGGGRAAAPPVGSVTEPLWRVPLVLPSLFVLLSTVASAIASIDQRLSFAGSYLRGQGVWTTLACGVLFALVVAHLRTAAQWRRVLYAVTLTSFAVASYAVLQDLRLDPVAWSVRYVRVGSTLGNPIFLGAFLGLVLFLTVREVSSRVGPALRRGDRATALGAGLLSAIVVVSNLVLQIYAIVLAESRGPLLGVLTGGFVGSLAFLLHVRARTSSTPPARLRSWAWLILIGISFATLATLWTAGRPGTPLTWLTTVPQLGRLAAPFRLEQGTAQARLLTWQGGLAALTDRTPLTEESKLDGTGRLLIGYGPEMFRLVFTRHRPPELARVENPGTSPDHGHNEVLDRLVDTGVIGLAGWFWWYGSFFFLGATGVFPGARSRPLLYWCLVTTTAALGAALPVLLGTPRLAFFGLPIGMLAGVTVFLVVLSYAGRGNGGTADAWTPRQGLTATLLAIVAAHFVEINLGIEVTSTKLYVWFVAGLLVAVHRGWLELGESSNAEAERPSARATALVGGLIAALVMATLAFPLVSNHDARTSALSVLAGSVVRPGSVTPVGAALWLPLLVWVAAAAGAASLDRRGRPERSSANGIFAATSLTVAGAYILLHAHRLSRTAEMRTAARPLLDVLAYIAAHASTFLWLVLVWMLGAGVALAWGRRASVTFCHRPRSAAAAAAVVGAMMVLVVAATLRPLAADTLVNHGSSFEGAGRLDNALTALRRGVALAPREPAFALRLGGALFEAARAAPPGPERVALFEQARAHFTRARELAPLDPDHTMNLGRLAAVEADLAMEEQARQASLALAVAEFEHALELRPGWALALSDCALAEYRRGNRERAFLLVDQALAMDARDSRVHRAAAHLHSLEAMSASAAGDPEAEREHREVG